MNYNYVRVRRAVDADIAGNYQRLRVAFMQDVIAPWALIGAEKIDVTLGNTLSIQAAPALKIMQGILRVKETEDSGYASLATIQTWMTSTSSDDRLLVLKDFNDVAINGVFEGGYQPMPRTPKGVYYNVPFRYRQRS